VWVAAKMQNEALNFNKFTQAIFHFSLFYSVLFSALWQLYLLGLRAWRNNGCAKVPPTHPDRNNNYTIRWQFYLAAFVFLSDLAV